MKTILVDAVDTFVIEGEGIYGPLFDLLEQYPHSKIIVTNANDEQMIEFGLTHLPHEVFTLKHDPEKTDPQYFVKLLGLKGMAPSDVVYFEHNKEAVKSAQSVGIPSYYYDPVAKDMIGLQEFLDAHL